MCSVSILRYINEYDREIIELVPSLPKHSPFLMNFPHPCSFLKRTFRSNLLIYELQLDIYWCWWAQFNTFCFERHLLSWLVRTFLHGFYICSNSSFQKPPEMSSVYFLQLNSNFGPCAIFPSFYISHSSSPKNSYLCFSPTLVSPPFPALKRQQ